MRQAGWLVINDARQPVAYATPASNDSWYTVDVNKAEFFTDRTAASQRRAEMLSRTWRVVPVVREKGEGRTS